MTNADDMLTAAESVARAVANATSLEDAVAAFHVGARDQLGVHHAFLLWADAEARRLFVMSSHGFPASGVGSEVAFGEGPIGICAERRVALRFGDVAGDLRYARALAARQPTSVTEIPLPQLPQTGSVVAVPIEAHGRVVGVVAAQHEQPAFFTPAHEAVLRVVGTALALQAILADASDVDDSAAVAAASPDAPRVAEGAPRVAEGAPLAVKHYADDDSVFVDGEYVVRGVAGKLLAHMLAQHAHDGRTAFSNRELRLEVGNKLAWAKDNLESRLILLRKRLDEKACGLTLCGAGRGRVLLVVSRALVLERS